MIGPPGAGKGTQSIRLAERLRIPHLSTGEILRAAKQNGTELGRQVAPIMAAGKLVPDELIASVVLERIEQEDCQAGYLLDGFPRTLPQCEIYQDYLDKHGQQLDHVIELQVPDDELKRRLELRFQEMENPRADDKPEAIPRRIDVYHSETSPLVDYYGSEMFEGLLKVVDGVGTMDEVFQRMLEAIGHPAGDAESGEA
jgi:adenylate kinase